MAIPELMRIFVDIEKLDWDTVGESQWTGSERSAGALSRGIISKEFRKNEGN